MKTFVTGVYGSGKTFLARKIAQKQNEKYINFDAIIDYNNKYEQFDKIISDLPDDFIMDAIPFDIYFSWNKFIEYEINNNCCIICCYCPDLNIWIKRIKQKQVPGLSIHKIIHRVHIIQRDPIQIFRSFYQFFKQKFKHLYKKIKDLFIYYLINPKNRVQFAIPDRLINKHYSAYRQFVLNNFSNLQKMKNVHWFDSIENEYTTYEEAMKRINPYLFELEERFYQNHLSNSYDIFYQTVEILDLVGYSLSDLTWYNISDITNWKGKTVLDIGCFHGYFSFKIEQEGAKKVIGLERGTEVLVTTQMIRNIAKSKCEFREWTGGDDYPECDTILLLNVLHHFGDMDFQKSALNKIPSETEVIFEINNDQLEMIKALFVIKRTLKSHRKDRQILLTLKK